MAKNESAETLPQAGVNVWQHAGEEILAFLRDELQIQSPAGPFPLTAPDLAVTVKKLTVELLNRRRHVERLEQELRALRATVHALTAPPLEALMLNPNPAPRPVPAPAAASAKTESNGSA